MQKSFFLLIGLFYFCSFSIIAVAGQNRDTHAEFSRGFRTPPPSAHPIVYHWWLGGNVDTIRLKQELTSLKNAGVAGITIFEIGSRDTVLVKPGPAFLGDESLKVLKYAIEEAGKLGLEVGLNTASSWNAGGSWLPPEHAAKSIYYTRAKVSGGTGQKIRLPFPVIPERDPRGRIRMIEYGKDGKPLFYEEIAVLAVPARAGHEPVDTSEIKNISRFFDTATETLNWDIPPGDWEIIRYVCSNSGENLILPSLHSAGPIVDHYDAEATEFHFLYIINRLESVIGDLAQSALKSLYMASYEARGFTWTTTLPDEFSRINGYEIYKFLPALFTGGIFPDALTAHFQADFQRTLSELMINNFYKKSKEVCNQFGLKNNCEAGGPGLPLHNVPVEPLKALGSGLDIPRGEFWINHSRWNAEGIDILRVVKEVSSASNIYGRKIVEMEAFTSFQHWQEGPFEMKPYGDRAFCEGMNKVVVHGSTHNPAGTGFPGIVYHAGTHYNDKRVWWPKIRPFNEYLSRISYILQEADYVADVLFYYGDTIPNYGGHKDSRFTVGPGYDYEIINSEILLQLEVKDNDLVIPGTGATFKILALADMYEIDPEVLLKLNELAGRGAIITGSKPSVVATRRIKPGMPDLLHLPDKLWTPFSPDLLKNREAAIFSDASVLQILEGLNVVPDISYTGSDLKILDYTHYKKDKTDFYFIRNTTGEWLSRDIGFRQKNRIPEIWDPVSGEITPVTVFNPEEYYITLPVTVAPYGSTFVVFREGEHGGHFTGVKGSGQHPPLLQYTKEGIYFWEDGEFQLSGKNPKTLNNVTGVKTLEGAWEVFFPAGWGAPGRAVFPELKSWTESEIDGIRYFSGIARYEKTFVHDVNSHYLEQPGIFLDLGDLSHVGEVWLNGLPLGITWARPCRFDITNVIKAGENRLVVEVANTWSNRIKGDAITGEKFTSTHIAETNVPGLGLVRLPWTEVPLLRSGLFGPVTIKTVSLISK